MTGSKIRFLSHAYLLLIAVIIFGRPVASHSSEQSEDRSQPPAMGPDSELVAEGIQLYLNYRFSEADSFFRSMARTYPEHPTPALYLLINENASYRCTGQFQHSADSLFAHTPRTIELFDTVLEKYPEDAKTYLYRATARSLKSRVYMNQGKYVPALKVGMSAILDAEKAQELDPDYPDINLATGTFDIFVSVILEHYSMFRGLFGSTDYRGRGIERLQTSFHKGIESRGEAGLLLMMVILYEEEDLQGAVSLGQTLIKTYPGNMEIGSLYCESLYLHGSIEEGDRQHSRLTAIRENWKNDSFRNMWGLRLRYLDGIRQMVTGQHDAALKSFQYTVEHYCLEFGWQKALSLFYSGEIEKSRGRIREAKAYYRASIDTDEVTRAVLNSESALDDL